MHARTTYPVKQLLISAILLVVGTIPFICSGSSVAQASSTVEQTSTPQTSPLQSVGQEIYVSDADNDGSVDLNTGDVLVVELPANLTTGYRWEVGQVNNNLLRPVADIEFQASSSRVGAPGTQTLRFDAVASGNAILRLVYRRPWESVPPLQSFMIEARIEDTGAAHRLSGKCSPPRSPYPCRVSLLPCQERKRSRPFPPISTGANKVNVRRCATRAIVSCWAFSAVGAVESNILIHDGATKDVAEQYLVSCNIDGWGCDGGKYAEDYFLSKVPPGEPGPGAVYEVDMPYTASDSPCNSPHAHHERIASWSFLAGQTIPSPTIIKQAIYDHGPLDVSVCAGPAMQSYGGGIFATSEASRCPYMSNHAVALVGWDDTDQIWYMRNSWGSSWARVATCVSAGAPVILDMQPPISCMTLAMVMPSSRTTSRQMPSPSRVGFTNPQHHPGGRYGLGQVYH